MDSYHAAAILDWKRGWTGINNVLKKILCILACSAGIIIFGARVHIFLLGHHLRFGNCGGLGRGNICRGSWCKWKNEHQPSIGQASNYNPRWRHRKPDLASVPLQNNACTAGYMHSKDGVRIAHARRASFQIQNGGCVTRVSRSCHQPHLPHL